MTDSAVLDIGLQAMIAAAKLTAPILIVALAVGLGVGMLQSVTQIQEATLTFVPKFLGVGLVILFAGNWMLHELISFTQGLYEQLPALISG
jgi:flagellar biosynthetic protein FliQ